MAKRNRRPVDPGDFEDPLKNYDVSAAEDEFERALAENSITDIETKPFKTVPTDTPIGDIVKLMADLEIGCVLVTNGENKLAGIFTQRDLLMNVVANFDAVKNKPVSELMTEGPVSVHETDNPATAINLMSTGDFRHIPVLDVDDKVVGLVGPRRTTAYLQQYFPKD